ncbi:MAG: trehalose-phosphatase [Myxococcales bacterium]|nr:trehalose-phosphatase [Myxococcales bacterium]MDD9966259.1 trehalose-phosphatase [Myxococcales bacterium]
MSAATSIVDRILALPRPLLLCFDLDGTLCSIVDDPKDARVPRGVQQDLRQLTSIPRVHLAILTGRDAGAARRMLRVPGIYRGLEHGRLIVPPGQRVQRKKPRDTERAMLDAFEAWAKCIAIPAGGELERKRSSRALHVRRLAQRDKTAARALLAQATQRARSAGLHPRPGRWVVEAELTPGDKGTALRSLARRTRARGVVYAGDDITDTPALRTADELGGVGIFVRSAERPRKPRGISCSVAGPETIARVVNELAHRLAPP